MLPTTPPATPPISAPVPALPPVKAPMAAPPAAPMTAPLNVLCWVGVTAGQDEQLMQGNLHRITLWVGGLLVFLGSLYYFFVHRQMRR